MGTDGTSEDSGQPEADNVIRFPRDWFGSKDDLIPIGPAADRLAEIAAEREDAINVNFWGESSDALQQPVDLPRDEDAATAEPADDHGAKVRALHVVRPSPPRRTRSHGPRLHVPRAALAFAAMLIAAIGIFVSGVLTTRSHPAQPVSSNALSSVVTRSAPSRSVVTPPALFLDSSQAQLMSESQLALQSAARAYRVKAAPTQSLRHVVRRSRRTTAVGRHVTGTPAPTGATSVTSVVTEVAPSDLAPETDSSALSSTPVQSTKSSAPSSSASSSSGSSATPSGATSLGGVVGAQCNPQCSG